MLKLNKTPAEFVKLVDASLVRETEKAVLLDVTIDTAGGRAGRKIWFPKSQAWKEDGQWFAKAWLVGRKNAELPRGVYCIEIEMIYEQEAA